MWCVYTDVLKVIEKLREMTELTPDERIEKRAEEQKQKSQRDDEYTR